MKYIPIVILLLTSCGPSQKTQEVSTNIFKARTFGITVSDMEASMDWYISNLSFKRDTVVYYQGSGITVGMMHQGEFYIELISFEQSMSKSDFDLPKDYSNLHGFFKIGFQTDDIEELYNEMSSNDKVNVVAPLDDLPAIENYEFPKQYFLVTDPDGNYVQFFSRNSNQSQPKQDTSPFLIALSTPDLDATLEWYIEHLGAKLVGEKVGNPGNERALLEKDDFILEIGQFVDDVGFETLEVPEGIWRSKVNGISKLSFLVDSIQTPYNNMKQSNIIFDFDLTEKKSMVGDRYFMIQDLIGTSLQFFELNH